MSNFRPFKALWMGVMLGILIATAPVWLSPEYRQHSNYDAPWIFPSFDHFAAVTLAVIAAASVSRSVTESVRWTSRIVEDRGLLEGVVQEPQILN